MMEYYTKQEVNAAIIIASAYIAIITLMIVYASFLLDLALKVV